MLLKKFWTSDWDKYRADLLCLNMMCRECPFYQYLNMSLSCRGFFLGHPKKAKDILSDYSQRYAREREL